MKPLRILSIAALAVFFFQYANAQPKGSNILQPPPANTKIDGDLKEWGDSLRYYNEEKKLNYTLANDNDNLYMAIRINDHSEQMRVINAGLTLSINTKGKKKEMYSVTFPVADGSAAPMLAKPNADQITAEDRDELMRARLTKLRNIKVTGFPDIEGENITTSNTYGIKTALNYDDNGYLVYEAAIPLKFFHADAPDKSEWAFNIRINGLAKPEGRVNAEGEGRMGGGRGGMGGGRGGMGGGGGRGGMGGGGRGGMRGGGMGQGGNSAGGDRSEMTKPVDFWEKFYVGSKP